MRFPLSKVKPNPFRNIERYPIDREKVDALKASIGRTSFWDNVVARRDGDAAEIAYGHHRLVALRELYPPEHEIDLIVRDLPDAQMLHVMADENMREWTASADVVVETVRAVRDFIVSGPAGKRLGPNGGKPGSAADINAFLGWPSTSRVEDALAIIAAEEKGILLPEDTRGLGIEQATVMRAAVGRIDDPAVRRAAIVRVRAGLTSHHIGKRGINEAVESVRRETGYDRNRPRPVVPPASIADAMWREIDAYFRTAVTVNGQSMTRSAVLRLIAENRNAEELIRSVRPWADQLADALDQMAVEATRLAELLRAEQAVTAGV